jgi:hypothetical protein
VGGEFAGDDGGVIGRDDRPYPAIGVKDEGGLSVHFTRPSS